MKIVKSEKQKIGIILLVHSLSFLSISYGDLEIFVKHVTMFRSSLYNMRTGNLPQSKQ